MFESAIFIAILLPTAIANLQTQPPVPSPSVSLMETYRAETPSQLSMGPDPGGKTGATVTPETTKTGQPSVDGAGGSTQSGASGAATSGAAKNGTDPSTGLSSRAEAFKQQRDSNEKATGTTPPPSSTTGQSR